MVRHVCTDGYSQVYTGMDLERHGFAPVQQTRANGLHRQSQTTRVSISDPSAISIHTITDRQHRLAANPTCHHTKGEMVMRTVRKMRMVRRVCSVRKERYASR